MKKIWTLVLVLVLAVSAMFVFTACDKEPEEPTVVETFYKVTYVYKNGDKTTELSTQQVSVIAGFTAEQIAALDSVKNNGYGFSGWYADADCTVPFDFTQKPTADVTVYASRGNLAGDNVEWFPLYDTEEGGFILLFNGTGAMYDYDNKSDTPWADIAPLVTSISFGEGITRIGNYTCTDMEGLDFIYVPKSVRTIGDYAFAGSSVVSVAMRNGVKTIGTAAFSGCKNLVSIVLPADLETIGEDAFYDVPKLAQVGFFGDGDIMEDPATEGKNFKFVENCLIDVVNKTLVVANNAATITVDPSVKVIADGAFINKTALTTVYLPENLTKIGDNAFSACSKLAKVLIAEKDAYLVNTKAVVIELPDTVEYLGKSAFNKCTAINGAVY
ncbi:MAG: leucine-rich repeat protein, partial [Clostridia bacterium]|nr:leucine-rich repeat protein [Clostridia bacterium]